MQATFRLPDGLAADARARAGYLGISLNALVCVALDAYLRGSLDGQAAAGAAPGGVDAPSKTTRQPEPTGEPRKLTRAEKQALYEQRKAAFKASLGQ
ncbi:MAG: hypothetical protein VW687_02955 [Curvibacter sp.]